MVADSSYVFWTTSEVELNKSPSSFPAEAIHFFRLANFCLNLLNAYWFHKMASKAMEVLLKPKDRKTD